MAIREFLKWNTAVVSGGQSIPEAANPCRSALALQIVGAAEDGFVAFEQQFRFLYANPAAERLLGMKKAGLIGRCQWEAFPITAATP